MSYGGRTDGLFHRSIQESGSAATVSKNSQPEPESNLDILPLTGAT